MKYAAIFDDGEEHNFDSKREFIDTLELWICDGSTDGKLSNVNIYKRVGGKLTPVDARVHITLAGR